jgi:hypothetical protein
MDYLEFRAQYEERHPASVPVRVEEVSPYPRILQVAIFIMFISAALLSGVHTVPVIQQGLPPGVSSEMRDVTGIAAFIGVEMAILLSAFAMVGGGNAFVRSALYMSIGTALVANVYSVIKAFAAVAGGDIGALIVAAFLGIAAPSIAGLSGKMFVDVMRAKRGIDRRANEAYQESCQLWDARVLAAWKADARKAINLSNGQHGQGGQKRRVSSKTAKVRQYYVDNPSALDTPIREIADKLGVGRQTVSNARQKVLSNGHRERE